MTTSTFETQTDEELQTTIVNFLNAELPECLRVMNAPSIFEGILFGEESVEFDDPRYPSEEVYDRFENIVEKLAEEGKIAKTEIFGMAAYHATPSNN